MSDYAKCTLHTSSVFCLCISVLNALSAVYSLSVLNALYTHLDNVLIVLIALHTDVVNVLFVLNALNTDVVYVATVLSVLHALKTDVVFVPSVLKTLNNNLLYSLLSGRYIRPR